MQIFEKSEQVEFGTKLQIVPRFTLARILQKYRHLPLPLKQQTPLTLKAKGCFLFLIKLFAICFWRATKLFFEATNKV